MRAAAGQVPSGLGGVAAVQRPEGQAAPEDANGPPEVQCTVGVPRRRLLLAGTGAAVGWLSGCAGVAGASAPAGTAARSATAGASVEAGGPQFAAVDLAQAERLRAAALRDDTAWQLLQSLCNDVGARPAGSPADAQAATWAQLAMRRLNLQQVRAEGFAMRAWVRGPASARLLFPVQQELVMAALGNSVAAPPGGIDAEVAWYPDLAALRADTTEPAASRAHGRIVFVDQKMERARDGRGYGPAVGARINGAVEAAKRGALALCIRSIGTDRQRVAHTGAMRYEVGVPRIPAFAISVPDADALAGLHAQGHRLRMQLQLQSQSDVDARSQNVIGEVAGSDLAHEVVLISAHLDSWDLGPGAQDDAAGVAIVCAAAALLPRLQLQPRRTIRLVLFGNEENGFDGARHYGDLHGGQVHQWVGESDFGAGKVWQMKSRVKPAALPLVRQMAQVLAPLGVAWPDEGANTANPGPDAAVLMRRPRWPALQLSQDGSDYFDVHHTVNDTLDRINPSTLPQNVACWAVTAWLAAQAPMAFGPVTL
jgi:carboxypeptidase Q